MAAQTKTARLRALGWNISPIPRLVPEGLITYPDGRKSRAFLTTDHAREWLVNPPEGHPAAPRKVEGRRAAVQWAWVQATAPRPEPSLIGVQSLAALAVSAAASGQVLEDQDEDGLPPPRPDAELLALCREAMACDQAADAAREDRTSPWTDQAAHRCRMDRLTVAVREKDRLVPLIFDQEATTAEGLCAMAEVLETLYENSRGLRAAAVRSLAHDVLKVLRARVAEGDAR
jgi:hypothetical protein